MFIKSFVLAMSVMFVALFVVGCVTTEQVPYARESGFLGDYSQLHHGKSG